MEPEPRSDRALHRPDPLLRLGVRLEVATLVWNVVGVVVLAIAATSARSVGLAGFGLDSLIEIGASAVVIWELTGLDDDRSERALRFIGFAFVALAVYLVAQSVTALVLAHRPSSSPLGVAWTLATVLAMYGLAFAKSRVGHRLANPVLVKESRVTVVDGTLALAVLVGLLLSSGPGWWWIDPVVGLVLAAYATTEARQLLRAR